VFRATTKPVYVEDEAAKEKEPQGKDKAVREMLPLYRAFKGIPEASGKGRAIPKPNGQCDQAKLEALIQGDSNNAVPNLAAYLQMEVRCRRPLIPPAAQKALIDAFGPFTFDSSSDNAFKPAAGFVDAARQVLSEIAPVQRRILALLFRTWHAIAEHRATRQGGGGERSAKTFYEQAFGLGSSVGGAFFIGNVLVGTIVRFIMVPLIEHEAQIFG